MPDRYIMTNLGAMLVLYRKHYNLTLDELSKTIGISKSVLKGLEYGETNTKMLNWRLTEDWLFEECPDDNK